jgi:hypothetical protein
LKSSPNCVCGSALVPCQRHRNKELMGVRQFTAPTHKIEAPDPDRQAIARPSAIYRDLPTGWMRWRWGAHTFALVLPLTRTASAQRHAVQLVPTSGAVRFKILRHEGRHAATRDACCAKHAAHQRTGCNYPSGTPRPAASERVTGRACIAGC